MINPNDSAFPVAPPIEDPSGDRHHTSHGLSIRAHFASMAMQGLCHGSAGSIWVAKSAVAMADALIEAIKQMNPHWLLICKCWATGLAIAVALAVLP